MRRCCSWVSISALLIFLPLLAYAQDETILAQQIEQRFKQVATQVGSAKKAFDEANRELEQDTTIPTPPKLHSPDIRRYDLQAVKQFANPYIVWRGGQAKQDTLKYVEALESAFQNIFTSRLNAVEKVLPNPLKFPVHIYIDCANPNSIEARPSYTGKSYTISLGSELVRRIDNSLLGFTGYLLYNFRSRRTGFFTEGLKMEDVVSVPEFLTIATQLNAQNQSRQNFTSAGGAAKSPFERLMGAFKVNTYLRSPSVPEDIKHLVLISNGNMEHLAEEEVPPEEVFDSYRDGNLYIQALHYYLLRDVLSYIIAHECSHFIQIENDFQGSIIEREIDADRRSVSILQKLQDTDPRNLTIAMAAFANEIQKRGIKDPDHPFTPDRLATLYKALNDGQPNLFLDIDTGQRLLWTPLNPAPSIGVRMVQTSFGLSHTIRTALTFVDNVQHHSILGVTGDVELYQLKTPGVTVAKAKVKGDLNLGEETYIERGMKETQSRGTLEIQLPVDFWSVCADCGVRLIDFKLSNSLRQPPTWTVPKRTLSEMFSSLSSLPEIRRSYEMLFLARGLFVDGRYSDAAVAYSRLSTVMPSLLSPADYLRWAKSLPIEQAAHRADILKSGVLLYPETPNLSYLAGIEAERAGRIMDALEAYFNEINGISDSPNKIPANMRFISTMMLAKQDTPEDEYLQGFKKYIMAQLLLEADNSKKEVAAQIYEKASQHFLSATNGTGSFSARFYKAETTLYASMLTRKPLSKARALFAELIQIRPQFLPSYVHLFHISTCEMKYDEAEGWIMEAIRQNPFVVHPMVEKVLPMIDQKRLNEVCE